MKLFSLVFVLAFTNAAWGQPSPAERFTLATRLYSQGNKVEALRELTELSNVSASAPAFMNIAIIESELGHPEASVDAAERALAQASGLSERQKDRLKVIRDLENLKLGSIAVTTPVEGVEVWLEGTLVGKSPFTQPLRARAGTVHLVAVAPKHAPLYRQVVVTAEQTVDLALELSPSEIELATVRLTSSTPECGVYVDDQLVGATPRLRTVTVVAGTRKISLRRTGYLDAEKLLTLAPGSTVELVLDPVARQDATTGLVQLVSSEGNVDLTLDGQRRGIIFDEKSFDLAAGRHQLLLERDGFLPINREVTVGAAETVRLQLVFEPTAERRAGLASGRTIQRVLGYVGIGIGSAGIIASSIFAFGWFPYLDRYWKRQIDDADAQVRANKGCAVTMNPEWLTCDQIVMLSTEKRSQIARDQSFALIGLAASAGAVTAGVLSLVLAPDLRRYERPLKNPDFVRDITVTPIPGGAAVSASGQF